MQFPKELIKAVFTFTSVTPEFASPCTLNGQILACHLELSSCLKNYIVTANHNFFSLPLVTSAQLHHDSRFRYPSLMSQSNHYSFAFFHFQPIYHLPSLQPLSGQNSQILFLVSLTLYKVLNLD